MVMQTNANLTEGGLQRAPQLGPQAVLIKWVLTVTAGEVPVFTGTLTV